MLNIIKSIKDGRVMMGLYQYAFCPGFSNKLEALAQMCPEEWSFSGKTDNSILKNYIFHTFEKLYEDRNIGDFIAESKNYSLINTGLYTMYNEEIYGLFLINRNKKQKWMLDGFYTEYQLRGQHINPETLPKRANYFDNPACLVFDTNCEIIPQYAHIFDDNGNALRIPPAVRQATNRNLLFDAALKLAKKMIDANYKTAIPQYYNGKIQLLIPVCLQSPPNPDLALVVSKSESETVSKYYGHTCLTLEMAYNNARLIARPDSMWLKP